MSSTDVLIGAVIDRSGSMTHLASSTISGFNAFVEEQRGIEGQALLSLTLFDTSFDVRYVATDLREIPLLGTVQNPYHANGGTALYDAVGTTVKGIEAWQKAHPDFDGAVKVLIMTDGEENSSHEWHIIEGAPEHDTRDLNNLIRYKQEVDGWEFVFLGAGGAAWTEGQKFSSVGTHLNYAATPTASAGVYAGLSRSLASSRSEGVSFASAIASDDELTELVEENT